MRIGFDASVVRGQRTGVENYALRLLEALAEVKDVEVIAFSDHDLPEVPGLVVRRGVGPLGLWRQVVLPRLAREFGCTSLHSPVTAVPLWMRAPVAATVHDLAWLELPECYPLRQRLVQRFWLKRACSAAAALLCVSDATRERLNAFDPGIAGKARTIHSGPVAARLTAPSGDEAGRVFGKFGVPARFVLAVGRVERRKNPVKVVRAFARATGEPDLAGVGLVFAGAPGNAFDATVAVARELRVTERVVFCSHVGGELGALYAAAELLVYASRSEGFGHPPFEAISLGTPVVAADIPAVREVLADGAELVDPSDEDALAAAIRHALRDGAYRQHLLARGKARLGQFSWRAAANEVAALHRSLT